MTPVTCDTILQWIKEQVENREPISPDLYLDAAFKLDILLSDERDKLIELQQQVAALIVTRREEGKSVAEAKMYAEASDIAAMAKRQKGKIEDIQEIIRLSKIRSKMKSEEMRSGL